MRVAMIGTGYVGLVSGTCFAEIGHSVVCLDIDQQKIEILKSGGVPIYEPGLKDLIARNVKAGHLTFSNNYEDITAAQIIFLGVGTPSRENGEANLDYLYAAAKDVAQNMKDGAIVVIKSTVPVGTHLEVARVMHETTNKKFSIVNNPEFLKEGSAIDDFMKPDRVVIGHADAASAEMMDELYAPLVRQGNPIIKMSNMSAEMTKYAANSFLATKISFINEIAKLCDIVGADIEEVRHGITSDQRIGKHFLYPGAGYGGSCFPKDVSALLKTAKKVDMEMKVIQATEDANRLQKTYLFEKMMKHYQGNIKGKVFAFWGVSFKPNTDDIREAPAIYMAEAIYKAGGKVQFYDSVAAENFEKLFLSKGLELKRAENKYEVLKGADALVLMTEWGEFRSPDYEFIKEALNDAVIFDGRNLFSRRRIQELGFQYYAIGRKI